MLLLLFNSIDTIRANYCTRTTSYCKSIAFQQKTIDNPSEVITLLGAVSKKIANQFVLNGFIQEGKEPIYAYGFELLLATCVNIILVLIISAAFHHIYSGLFFLLAFIPIRSTAGGYHANSHFSCCLVFVGAYILVLTAISLMTEQIAMYVCLIFVVVSSIIVFRYAPVEARNKPLSQRVRKSNRYRSIVLACLNLALVLVMIYLPVRNKWISASYFLGVAAAAMSMLVVVLFGEREEVEL